jgi:hypothetical protein
MRSFSFRVNLDCNQSFSLDSFLLSISLLFHVENQIKVIKQQQQNKQDEILFFCFV